MSFHYYKLNILEKLNLTFENHKLANSTSINEATKICLIRKKMNL